MNTCESCGSNKYGIYCVWCDEDHFIAKQDNMEYEDVYEKTAFLPDSNNKEEIKKESKC